jgi:CRP-like cAMP-binding protein
LFSPTYHCDGTATTNAVVRLYPKAAVLSAFRHDPGVAQAFMAMLGRQVMSVRTRLEQRNIRSARDRRTGSQPRGHVSDAVGHGSRRGNRTATDPVVSCTIEDSRSQRPALVRVTIGGTLGGLGDGTTEYKIGQGELDRIKQFVLRAGFPTMPKE